MAEQLEKIFECLNPRCKASIYLQKKTDEEMYEERNNPRSSKWIKRNLDGSLHKCNSNNNNNNNNNNKNKPKQQQSGYSKGEAEAEKELSVEHSNEQLAKEVSQIRTQLLTLSSILQRIQEVLTH